MQQEMYPENNPSHGQGDKVSKVNLGGVYHLQQYLPLNAIMTKMESSYFNFTELKKFK